MDVTSNPGLQGPSSPSRSSSRSSPSLTVPAQFLPEGSRPSSPKLAGPKPSSPKPELNEWALGRAKPSSPPRVRHFQTEPGQYSLLEKLMLLTCITTLISNAVILIIGSVVAILALLAFRSQF